MLKNLNVCIILSSVYLINCLCEAITQWRRNENNVTFRKDYTFIEPGKSFYKYHATLTNWHDAIKECDTEGAQLFYPETKEELDDVIQFWDVGGPKYNFWLGLSDLKTKGVFLNINNNNKTYMNWGRNQPNNFENTDQRCVELYKPRFYNDVRCDWNHTFICKKTLSSLERNRTTTTSTTSCNTSIQSNNSAITLKTFVFWPNATVPFFINLDHFDEEQEKVILKSLAMFAHKTCIKFAPLMTAPSEEQHVMTFINPEGLKRCKIETKGHSNYKPHVILLGYNCLNTRELDMIIMRALGLPFEHNRAIRDRFIDVWIQNIEPGYIQLFTKENILPIELDKIPYDYYSIMHFGERDYSKNGHRTIRFKNHVFSQARNGLTPADIKKIGLTAADIKKIGLIYGPECRIRDRAEKITKCRTYPGVPRRKREIIERPANMSICVNPNSVHDKNKTDCEVPATTLRQTEGNGKQLIQSP